MIATGSLTSSRVDGPSPWRRNPYFLSCSAGVRFLPGLKAGASSEEPGEGWGREEERKGFSEVVDAITRPNLPSGGTMVVSYSSLLESAHRVGRALHHLDDPQLVKAVAAEAAVELAAVDSAELGDLSGRAQQAVLLSREDASPVQVAAAVRVLINHPPSSQP
ncbi:hypothetical protein [Streptomyces sp. CA-106110]|uniref:hypothetical protein n=1 Tax=Streptomyces sp. CA-106110 TaxID=3240044 RepID=UPI003D8D03AC